MTPAHPAPYHGHGLKRPDLQPVPDKPYRDQVWLHVKSKQQYIVRGLARSEKTGEVMVLYDWLDGTNRRPSPSVPWARPVSEWEDVVTLEDGTVTPRFVYVGYAE